MNSRALDSRRLIWFVLPCVLALIPALQIVRYFRQSPDIWWTPQTQLVSLADGEDRVRVYAHGVPLRTLIDEGQVRVSAGAETRVLGAREIGLRVNHWPDVQASRAPMLMLDAAIIGVLLGLMIGMLAMSRPPSETQPGA
jgi:hypothetical protein